MINKTNEGKSISLDSLILFIFTVTILYYLYKELSLAQMSFFWVVGLVLLFAYFLIDLKIGSKNKYLYKIIIIISLIILFNFFPLFNQIFLRLTISPYTYTHDAAMQMEEGAKFLLEGKNPYQENYQSSLGILWDGQLLTSLGITIPNPAINHFIQLPWHLIFTVPFYVFFNIFFEWYDQRVIYFLCYAASLFIIYLIPRGEQNKMMFLIFFGLNPLFIHHFIAGANDIFVFLWTVLSIFFIKRQKNKTSSFFLALAVLSKHSAWPLLPFYFFYLWLKEINAPFRTKIKNILIKTYPFYFFCLIFFGIFLIWDCRAFIEDIFLYPSGSLPTSFPIGGFGLSVLLLAGQVISNHRAYFPFWIPELLVGFPLLVYLIKLQRKRNTLNQVLFNYGLLLFALWFCSRFFHGNYIAYLSLIFITAYFIDEREKIDENLC